MMELHRWLRYALPGALFELTFGVWLYFDSSAYDSYPALPEFDTATAAAIAAATLPIGFILSVLMHSILWCRHAGWPFRRIEAATILRDAESVIQSRPLRGLVAGADLDEDPERAHAFLDAVLHLHAGSPDHRAALDRARALIDLMDGLATGFTAIVVSVLSIAGTLVVTSARSWSWSDEWDLWRGIVSGVALVLWSLLALLFLCSEHRVARITNHYLQALLVRPVQPPSAEAGTGGQPQKD